MKGRIRHNHADHRRADAILDGMRSGEAFPAIRLGTPRHRRRGDRRKKR